MTNMEPAVYVDKGGPDDGHTFRISVSVRGSHLLHGETRMDLEEFDPTGRSVDVRAGGIRQALEKASHLPVHAWFLED